MESHRSSSDYEEGEEEGYVKTKVCGGRYSLEFESKVSIQMFTSFFLIA